MEAHGYFMAYSINELLLQDNPKMTSYSVEIWTLDAQEVVWLDTKVHAGYCISHLHSGISETIGKQDEKMWHIYKQHYFEQDQDYRCRPERMLAANDLPGLNLVLIIKAIAAAGEMPNGFMVNRHLIPSNPTLSNQQLTQHRWLLLHVAMFLTTLY